MKKRVLILLITLLIPVLTVSQSDSEINEKPKVVYHKLKPGQTLYWIALQYYGKKSYVKKLFYFKSIRLKRLGRKARWKKPFRWMYSYNKWLANTLIKIPKPVHVKDKAGHHFSGFVGSDLSLELSDKGKTVSTSGSELSYLPGKNEQEFIEIFHALEIQEKDLSEKKGVKYLDYIIHKYRLWSPENLKSYIRAKQRLSTEEDKWHRLILMAYEYQLNSNWKKMYKEIKTNSIEAYLDELEQKDPEYHKTLTDFIEGNSNQPEKVFRKLFPNKKFPKEEWKNQPKEFLQSMLHTTLRNQFEEEYRKQNIYK